MRRPPLTLLLLALAATACGTTKDTRRFTRDDVAQLLQRLEVVGLVLGEFPLDGAGAVLDGDTIRVKGLTSSLRLLGIDTEETFKKESERAAYAAGWEQYKKAMRGSSSRPVKMATPVGEDAKHFAQDFFAGATQVRLERDHPGEIRDFYGRYLAYVFVKKADRWVNYNLECVRAGFSPYFVKYGRSRRFHQEFLAAAEEARAARRGIWNPQGEHYDDYEERLAWWGERDQVITRFEKAAAEKPDQYISLTRWDAPFRLEQRLAQEVVVLGSVSEIRFGERGPSVVRLARTRTANLDIVFFDKDVLLATGLQFKKGEYVQVKGAVQKYRDARGVEALQLVVSLPGQVLAPSEELDSLLNEPVKERKEEEGD